MDKWQVSKYVLYSNGTLAKTSCENGKTIESVDLKKVFKSIKIKSSIDFRNEYQTNVSKVSCLFKKKLVKNNSGFKIESNDAMIMFIPIRPSSNKKWILLFEDMDKFK